MNKFLFGILFCFVSVSGVVANDCLEYKVQPAVHLDSPDWIKTVVQPKQEMDFLHGNVVATMIDNYEFSADIASADNGWCVWLRRVDAVVGYSEFLVSIDKRHAADSCTYNAVLSHEDEHINAYLSLMDDMRAELKDTIYKVADSVMPVFIKDKSDIDSVIEDFNYELQSHPDMILVKQKIKATEEIRNKKIDARERGEKLKQCPDYNVSE